MAAMREFRVTIYYRDRVHEMLATAVSTHAALDAALKENRTLREAVRDGRASYEVATMGVAR